MLQLKNLLSVAKVAWLVYERENCGGSILGTGHFDEYLNFGTTHTP